MAGPYYPPPSLGVGGVQRFSYPAGAASAGVALVKATYISAQTLVTNDATENLFCSSGLLASETAGMLVKARGTIVYTVTAGTPNLTLRIAKSAGTSLCTMVLPLAAGSNQNLVFDLNLQFTTAVQTVGTGSTVFNSLTNSLVVGGITNQIFGGGPVSPLFVSLQWNSASPNFSAQFREGVTWEVYYPQTVT